MSGRRRILWGSYGINKGSVNGNRSFTLRHTGGVFMNIFYSHQAVSGDGVFPFTDFRDFLKGGDHIDSGQQRIGRHVFRQPQTEAESVPP